MQSGTSCTNSSIHFVVAALSLQPPALATPPSWLLDSQNQTRRFLSELRAALPAVHVLDAVDGYNHTEVIAALLESGLQFHSLSIGGKRWGKLATFLTKFRALRLQLARGWPFMLLLEEDVRVGAGLGGWLQRACAVYNRERPTLMQLSWYAEVLLIPLAGARQLVRLVRSHGIVRNDDQQLLDGRGMGTFNVRRYRKYGPEPPFTIVRPTNSQEGHIRRSRKMTWAELALLRLITNPVAARGMLSFGNPRDTDFFESGWR
jgi:hypothetical protein